MQRWKFYYPVFVLIPVHLSFWFLEDNLKYVTSNQGPTAKKCCLSKIGLVQCFSVYLWRIFMITNGENFEPWPCFSFQYRNRKKIHRLQTCTPYIIAIIWFRISSLSQNDNFSHYLLCFTSSSKLIRKSTH